MNSVASIELMKFLSGVATRLGVAKHVYVVGGAVRNHIIRRPIKDIDVVIDSVALKGKDSDWFAREVAKAIPTRTNLVTNNYGVALLHISGDWFLGGENLKGEDIEIANARAESYGGESGKGYKPSDVQPSTIEEDVKRREFTFNTLLWRLMDLADGPDKAEIIDLTGCGLRDLQEGVANCPSDPDKTFSDDPSRMVRAVKFLVKYGLRPSPDTTKSILRNKEKLKNIPGGHLSNLLINTFLREPTAKQSLAEMEKLGLLEVIRKIAHTDKAFFQALSKWADREASLDLFFHLMDVGMPVGKRVSFLSKAEITELRRHTIHMGASEADELVAVLHQPGKAMDTRGLIQELGLRGPEIRTLMVKAREALLSDPALAKHPKGLTDAVRRGFQQRRSAAIAGTFYHGTYLLDALQIQKGGFRLNQARGRGAFLGAGVYVSGNKDWARGYARDVQVGDFDNGRPQDAAILHLRINPSKPLFADATQWPDWFREAYTTQTGKDPDDYIKNRDFRTVARLAQRHGFDAIVYEKGTTVVYDPSKVKVIKVEPMPASEVRTAGRIPIYSGYVYLSRTKHRNLDADCDEVQDAVQRLKDGDKSAARTAAQMLSKHPRLSGFKGVVVPAPRSTPDRPPLSHFARELVAAGIGDRVESAVVRSAPVESSRKRRHRGLPGVAEVDHVRSMGVVPNGIEATEPVLIVDDIVTTGSTIRATAARLRKAGHYGRIIGAAAGYFEPDASEADACPVNFVKKADSNLSTQFQEKLTQFKDKLAYNKARGLGDTSDLWIAWRFFYQVGQQWSGYVISNLSIPSNKAKGVEMAARVFVVRYGRGKNPRPSIAGWFDKHSKRFELLAEATSWPQRQEGDGIFQHQGFRVHNTVGASDKQLQKVKGIIDQALKGVQKAGVPGLKQACYGDIYLVGRIERKNWAAWYYPSKDVIYLRPTIRGMSEQDITRNLIHEICHRLWRSRVDKNTKRMWNQYHIKLTMQGKAPKELPPVGTVLPDILKINNKVVVIDKYDGVGNVWFNDAKKGKPVGGVSTLTFRDWLKEVDRAGKFPSIYATTDAEEHFCEAVAHKGTGSLAPENLAALDAIILGKGDASRYRVASERIAATWLRMAFDTSVEWGGSGRNVWFDVQSETLPSRRQWPPPKRLMAEVERIAKDHSYAFSDNTVDADGKVHERYIFFSPQGDYQFNLMGLHPKYGPKDPSSARWLSSFRVFMTPSGKMTTLVPKIALLPGQVKAIRNWFAKHQKGLKRNRQRGSYRRKGLYVRFGKWGNNGSKVFLDSIMDEEPGLYGPQDRFDRKSEAGVSVYRVMPRADGGVELVRPDDHQAIYSLGSGYMSRMIKSFKDRIQKGEVYLVTGKWVHYGRTPVYGADGEPVLEPSSVRIVEQMDPTEVWYGNKNVAEIAGIKVASESEGDFISWATVGGDHFAGTVVDDDSGVLTVDCTDGVQRVVQGNTRGQVRITGGKGLKVYLDDERKTPPGWKRVYWPDEAIKLLQTGKVTEISLDHDLGDDVRGTGYDVILWLEEQVALHGFVPPDINVHSANTSAADKMWRGVRAIERLHKRNQQQRRAAFQPPAPLKGWEPDRIDGKDTLVSPSGWTRVVWDTDGEFRIYLRQRNGRWKADVGADTLEDIAEEAAYQEGFQARKEQETWGREEFTGKLRLKHKVQGRNVTVMVTAGNTNVGRVSALVYDRPPNARCTASITGIKATHPETAGINKIVMVGKSWLEEEYRGKKVGTAMYQALASVAFKAMGPFFFMADSCGQDSSTDAKRVWQSLARRYPSDGYVVAITRRPTWDRTLRVASLAAKYLRRKAKRTASMDKTAIIHIYNAYPEENTYDGPNSHVDVFAFDDLVSSLTAVEMALINDMDREAGGARHVLVHTDEERHANAKAALARYRAKDPEASDSDEALMPLMLSRYPKYTWRGYHVSASVILELQGAGYLGPTEDGKIGLSDMFLGKRQLYSAQREAAYRLAIKEASSAKYKDKKQVPKADGKGTTMVYEYSEKQVQHRNREKAKRVEALRKSIDKLRTQVKKDLKSKDPKTRLTAMAVGLMDATYERVGNDESAKSGHYGITGWLVKHVSFGKGSATISYVGKSGVKQKKVVEDSTLVSALKDATKGKSSDKLLCEGEDCKVKASDVNSYLKDFNITAKDIRGLHANSEMQKRLKEVRSKGGTLPSDKKEREKKLKDEFQKALEGAAAAVGHEPSTLKSQYLVPGLADNFLSKGEVMTRFDKKANNRAEAFVEGFFSRHPKLRKYSGIRVREKAQGGSSGHGEARQYGDEIWLLPKFWNLSKDVADFVFAHEVGHWALDAYGMGKLIPEATKLGVDMWDTLSLPFGQFNMAEAFADSFASYFTDRDVVRRYPEWTQLVEKVYGSTRKASRQARSQPLTPDIVARLRKDWLKFSKNVDRVRNLKDIEVFVRGSRRWWEYLGDMFVQIRKDLQGRIRMADAKKDTPWREDGEGIAWEANKGAAQWYLDNMEPIWNFRWVLMDLPGEPDPGKARTEDDVREALRKHDYSDREIDEFLSRRPPTPQSQLDQEAVEKWRRQAKKWFVRSRKKAPAAWKWLNDYFQWTTRQDFHGGGGDAFKWNTREKTIQNIDGFQIQLDGYLGTADHDEYIEKFRAGLAYYKRKAAKVYPWLLKNQLPIVLLFDKDMHNAAATYNRDHITAGFWTMASKPPRVANIIAHEMGHHIYKTVLNRKHREFWENAIKGDFGPLDLREVLSKMKPGEKLGPFGRRMEKEDPVLSLQVDALQYMPYYRDKVEVGMWGIKALVDKGVTSVNVPKHPITAYGAKNPEEAFCETLGNLVGYGPRTVLTEVKKWFWHLQPNVRMGARSTPAHVYQARMGSLAPELERRFNQLVAEWEALAATGEEDSTPYKEKGLEFGNWFTDTFRVEMNRTPPGGKDAKKAAQAFLWSVHFRLGQSANRRKGIEQVKARWEQFKPHIPTLVQKFSDEGGTVVLRQIKTSNATFINAKGLATSTFKKYVKYIDGTFSTLKGWRRKALAGDLKVVLAGPDKFRGTAAGSYKQESDTLLVRATPNILKRPPATYGSVGYILVHELGHRYERKVGVGRSFDGPQWVTTRYSQSTGGFSGLSEAFAELFALGHFGITKTRKEFGPTVQRFENLMSGEGSSMNAVSKVAGDYLRRQGRDKLQDALLKAIEKAMPLKSNKEELAEDLIGTLADYIELAVRDKLELVERDPRSQNFKSLGSEAEATDFKIWGPQTWDDNEVYIHKTYRFPESVRYEQKAGLNPRLTLIETVREVIRHHASPSKPLIKLLAPFFQPVMERVLKSFEDRDFLVYGPMERAAKGFVYDNTDFEVDWDDDADLVESPFESHLHLEVSGDAKRTLLPTRAGFTIRYDVHFSGWVKWER